MLLSVNPVHQLDLLSWILSALTFLTYSACVLVSLYSIRNTFFLVLYVLLLIWNISASICFDCYLFESFCSALYVCIKYFYNWYLLYKLWIFDYNLYPLHKFLDLFSLLHLLIVFFFVLVLIFSVTLTTLVPHISHCPQTDVMYPLLLQTFTDFAFYLHVVCLLVPPYCSIEYF